MNNSILIEGITFKEGESIVIKNCVFLSPDNNSSSLVVSDTQFYGSKKACDDYLHQQTDYYKWCKRKTGKW